MGEDLSPQKVPQEGLGEAAMEHVQDPAAAEGSHDVLQQLGKQIYEDVQDLLDDAEDFYGKGPRGWEKRSDPPSHITEEFQHNVKLHYLHGSMNPRTPLFMEKLSIQESEVVHPYKTMEGGGIILHLLEIPEEPAVQAYGENKERILETRSLNVKISADGQVAVNSYKAGDGRLWDELAEGPEAFAPYYKGVNHEDLDFGEEDLQHVLQLVKDIHADVREGVQLRKQPDTVVDSEKAYEMAHAGKDERDQAAALRSKVEKQRVFNEETIPAAREQLTTLATEQGVDVNEIAEFKHKDKVYELLDKSDSKVKAAIETLLMRTQYGDRIDDPSEISYQGNPDPAGESLDAEKADHKAERLENWAGILHDNPLSDAYKERFGLDEEITPETLIELEDELANGETEQAEGDKHQALANKLTRTFLDDIRSGRAGMWQ